MEVRPALREVGALLQRGFAGRFVDDHRRAGYAPILWGGGTNSMFNGNHSATDNNRGHVGRIAMFGGRRRHRPGTGLAWALIGGLALIGTIGCSQSGDGVFSPRPRVEGWSQRRLPGVSLDEAVTVSAAAVRQWFPRTDVRVSSYGLIRTGAVEYSQKGGTERIRDSIGYRNRLRRNATIEVRPTNDGCIVKCVVERQRLDTADRRVFQQNDSRNDVPNETPVARGDAGLRVDQQDAWTDMPRDRALEADILSAIVSRMKGATSPPSAETSAH